MVRDWLRRLGRRRARVQAESVEVRREVEKALQTAHGVIPIKEAADLLGLHRTAAYRTYNAGERDK